MSNIVSITKRTHKADPFADGVYCSLDMEAFFPNGGKACKANMEIYSGYKTVGVNLTYGDGQQLLLELPHADAMVLADALYAGSAHHE